MNEVKVDSWRSTKIAFLIVLIALISTISCIVVPDTFWHELEESEKIRNDDYVDGDRLLIIAETMERYERSRQLSRSIPCISKFLQNRSISFRYSTSVLPSIFGYVDRRLPVEINSLVHTLQVETATYTMNDVYAEERSENFTSSVIVLVIENSLDLENMNYTCYQRTCIYECEFVIMLTKTFQTEDNFLLEADTLQRSMWSKSVGRLIVLGSTRESVLLAGSRSFDPEQFCSPSAPVLLGSCQTSTKDTSTVWNFNAGPIVGRDLSMNGCTLVVAYYDHPPYSFDGNETADGSIRGLEGFMIEEILYSMNARLLRKMISPLSTNDSNEDNFSRITDEIGGNDGSVDIVIGGLLWNPNEGTDYTIAYDMVPLVWIIPVRSNVSLRGLVAPFSTFVWIAILCFIFLGILIKIFLIKDISFLDMLALFLGVSAFNRPTLPSSRMLFLCWTLFGFFMSQYYLASLADQLVNASNLQIDTMKELLSSGLELGGILRYADLFDEIDEMDDDVDEDVTIRSIRERFRVFSYEDYVLRLLNLLNGKDQSMALVVKVNVSNSILNFPKHYAHVLKENMGNYPLAIAVRKGFPCLRKINIKMQELIETGIMEYWARLVTLNGTYYRSIDVTTSENDVDLESVVPSFLLLIIGYFAGFCVLIIEIIAYPSKWLA